MIGDERGQSVSIARLFLSLGAAAMVYWVLDALASPILMQASEASNSAKADAATGWFQWVVANSPIGFALITFFGLIVVSIYQSGRI